MALTRTAFFSLVALSLFTLPATAAPLTARSSGVQAVHSGPGSSYPIVAKLADQERVRLDECTREQRWCHVIPLDGGRSGWVLGSYLIGSGAKNAVTPFEFQFNPMDLFPHKL